MSVLRRLLATCTRIALHLVTVVMFVGGLAALVAMLAVTVSTSGATWIAPLQQIGRSVAFTLLPAAIASSFLMPSRRQFVGSKHLHEQQELPAPLSFLMVGLILPVAWQLPTLFRWSDETLQVVRQIRGDGSDPLGLWVFPAGVAAALPIMAAMSAVVFTLTSAAVILGRPSLSFRVLRACVVLQIGLVIGSSLLLDALRGAYAEITNLMAASPDDRLPAAVTETISRHDAFAATLVPWFQWITIGYCIATAIAWQLAPREESADGTTVSDGPVRDDSVSRDSVTVQPMAATITAEAGQRSEASSSRPATSTPGFAPGPETSVFRHDTYAVRLKTSWLAAAFRLGSGEYTITPIPKLRSDAAFSFSQASGVLRQEPGGPEILRVQPVAHGLLKRRYAVTDRASVTLAQFERAGRDWEVFDAAGNPTAHVEEAEARSGFRRYVARVDGRDLCRYTWAMQGLGVWTAELDLEFQTGGGPGFDRSIAIALAPLLEEHARLHSQRYA